MSACKKRKISEGGGFPAILSRAGKEEDLNFELSCTESHDLVIVSSKLCHFHSPAGLVSRTRIVVTEDGAFDFQVLLLSKEKGKLSTVAEFLALCERMTNSEYKFCPGIDPDVYVSTYFSKIRYHVKTVRHLEVPFNRVDSIHCLLWHKLARNMLFEKDLESVPCKACKTLINNLNQRLKTAVTSPVRAKRQQPTSRCPLKYMSPASQKKRKENVQQDRSRNTKLLQKYSHTEVTLDDDQHEELSALVNAIDEQEDGNLQQFLSEAASHGVKDSVEEIWKMDRRKMAESFNKDQRENRKLFIFIHSMHA